MAAAFNFLQVYNMAMKQQDEYIRNYHSPINIPPAIITSEINDLSSSSSSSIPEISAGDDSSTADAQINAPEKNDSTQQSKPLLILHVGPPKTATTTIQDACTKYDTLLQSDQYHYLGKVNWEYADKFKGDEVFRAFFYACYNPSPEIYNAEKCEEERVKFKLILQQHLDAGHNVIASDESMSVFEILNSKSGWKMFHETFDGFHIRVVIAYRRYHEWLLSMYRHLYIAAPYHLYMREYPDNGGAVVPTFAEFAQKVLSSRWEKNKANNDDEEQDLVLDGVEARPTIGLGDEHATLHTYKLFREVFGLEDVVILNHHDVNKRNILLQFMCDALPSAHKTCAALKKARNLHSYRSLSHTVAYELITQRAYELYPELADVKRRKLFLHVKEVGYAAMHTQYMKCGKGLSREERRRKCNMNGIDFPLVCDMDGDVETLLLNRTKKYEEEVKQLPGLLHRDGMSTLELEESFASAVQSKTFCSVDVDEALRGFWGNALLRRQQRKWQSQLV